MIKKVKLRKKLKLREGKSTTLPQPKKRVRKKKKASQKK